jgi:hypothetical protein
MAVSEEHKTLASWLGGLITSIRSRSIPIHETWLRNYSAWRNRHTRRQFLSETFNHTLPASRRAVERSVVRVAQMLLPSSQFFEVYPGAEMDEEEGKRAEAVWSYEFFVLSKKIPIRRVVKQWARCYNLYGRAISKTTVRVEPTGEIDPATNQEKKLVWPTCRAVDPFMFYVWPETATTIDEAVLVFEDNMMPWEIYDAHAKSGVVDPIPQEELAAPEWPVTLTRRLAASQLTNPSDTAAGPLQEKPEVKALVNFVALSEVWMKKNRQLRRIWLVWNVADGPRVVADRVSKMPAPPYRMALARELPGEQFTSGLMDDLEPLNAFLNDQVNITLETQATTVWPPAAVDPTLIRRSDTLRYRPRQKWLVDPAGVKWMEPPDNMARLGFAGIQMGMTFIDTFSGSTPLSEGTPGRNMPRAGFAVSSLMNLAMADIKDVAEIIEDELLTPLLADIYRLSALLVPSDQVVRVPGARDMAARRVTMSDLVGDWEFRWVGSLQSQDFQVRAQRLITLLGTLGDVGPLIMQDLMAKGKRINWVALLQRLWRDGVGERGADSIIEDIPPQEMIQNILRSLLVAQQGQNGGPAPAGAPVLTGGGDGGT